MCVTYNIDAYISMHICAQAYRDYKESLLKLYILKWMTYYVYYSAEDRDMRVQNRRRTHTYMYISSL